MRKMYCEFGKGKRNRWYPKKGKRMNARAKPLLDDAQHEALELIGKIADRAVNVYAQWEIRAERRTVLLDLTACHFRIIKLRLGDMLTADDGNFMHDIAGINRHIDRQNHKLRDCFLPRFADFGQ